jgi:hypothetical protein
MWIGRRPASLAPAENPAASEAFAAAVTAACGQCGCDVEDYVAAAGDYGSWMVRFTRDGQRHRLVWNGKAGQLVLERATAGTAWDGIAASIPATRDLDGYLAAVAAILGEPPGGSGAAS